MISRRLHIIIGGEAMTLCHELNRMVAGDPGTGRRSYAAKKGAPLFHSNYILRFTTRKAFLYTHVGEVDELSLFSSTFFLSHSSPLIFFLFFFFTCDGVSEACSLFVSFLSLSSSRFFTCPPSFLEHFNKKTADGKKKTKWLLFQKCG